MNTRCISPARGAADNGLARRATFSHAATEQPGRAGRSMIPTGSARTVAALYVERGGSYWDLPGVDPWDESRDARLYAGPWPVVAHPPCQRWGNMAFVNYKRWGGEHNKPGNDGGCFQSALDAVNTYGGVLEHPKNSRAWHKYGLERPRGYGWQASGCGWTCEVWQSAYGHRANKATWLYYVGREAPPELNWTRPVGSHQIGFHDQRGKARNKPTLSRREALSTPIPFRDVLLALARNANLSRGCAMQPGRTVTGPAPPFRGASDTISFDYFRIVHLPNLIG